jgi:hypothetical protein
MRETSDRQAASQARQPASHPVKKPKPGAPWVMPPIIKVYEAFGALADGRVHLQDECHATVASSDYEKIYQVENSADCRTISSNDNASYWQGYLGYPAIAVMLKRGLLVAREDAVSALAKIPWKKLNRQFRGDYCRTIRELMRTLEARGCDPLIVKAEAEAVLQALRNLAPLRGVRRLRPP